MSTQPSPATTSTAAPPRSPTSALALGIAPPVLTLSLAQRMRQAFPEVAQSVLLIIEWTREEIWQRLKWTRDVRAIDDPIEQSDIVARLDKLVRAAVANDSPRLRRQTLATWAEFRALLERVHAATETTATDLDPRCPASLLAETSQ